MVISGMSPERSEWPGDSRLHLRQPTDEPLIQRFDIAVERRLL